MTSQGPWYPSSQPAAHPPVQPPLGPPHNSGGDRRRPQRWAISLAAVIGLAVGAGIVGGLWLTNRGGDSSAPPPVLISLNTLPTEILGEQRDDLAAAAPGGEQASKRGKDQADLYASEIPLYQRAYGGNGIRGSYGIVENKVTYTLLIVNGIQPAPLVASDALITRLQAISPPNPVAAPGSASTQCAAQPGKPVVLNGADALAQAKRQVLDDAESLVTCVRSDRTRNVSIQLQGHPVTDTGQSAAARAKTMASEVDRIWTTLVS